MLYTLNCTFTYFSKTVYDVRSTVGLLAIQRVRVNMNSQNDDTSRVVVYKLTIDMPAN